MFLLSSTLLLNIFGLVWETDAPEHLGMDQDKLEEARDYALTGGGSGCIIKGGKMVMAWGDQQQKYDLYSATKSIGGIALALAMMDGKTFWLVFSGRPSDPMYSFSLIQVKL